MFGKLPEIFGRDFVIGYFLPSAIFVAGSIALISRFEIPIPPSLGKDILKDAVIFTLVSWLGGVILLAINRNLIRIIEGYGRLNPARLYKRVELYRFTKLTTRISELNLQRDTYKDKGEEVPLDIQEERIRCMRKAAVRFPDEASWLLPTAFGNTIRAFEVYPRVIYGFDSIHGWNRLLAILPKEYRELVEAAKAQVDFWINLSTLSVLFLIEYLILVNYSEQSDVRWMSIIIPCGVATVSYIMAINAAVAWGDMVKAAFDVFLPELRKKFELDFPENKEKERSLWTGVSQAIIYRLSEPMPDRVPQAKDKS